MSAEGCGTTSNAGLRAHLLFKALSLLPRAHLMDHLDQRNHILDRSLGQYAVT